MQVKSQALYQYVTQVLGDIQRPTSVCNVMEGIVYPKTITIQHFMVPLKIVHDIHMFILGLKRHKTLPDISTCTLILITVLACRLMGRGVM